MVISAGTILLAFRPGDAGAPERSRRQPEGWYGQVGLVNLAQFVAIAMVVLVFITVGAPALVPPFVSLIVGLHFFPLARLFDQPQYSWTAAGLCVAAFVGLVILAVGAGPEASRVGIGVLVTGTLWGTALRLALHG
ncbi:MAG: DUF7010 family protein [Pseudonocardia sp.]